ncbi:MAG: hypothetical protein IPK64_15060 [bacterium]|nr:hypothetical protein [bacterium]
MKGRLAPNPATTSTGAPPQGAPVGDFLVHDGEECHRIAGYHRLAPFLMTLASDTDLWMFITSGGGLTAGRVDPDGALFPYRTVDQLHDAHHHTGPVTLIRVERPGASPVLWEPFGRDGDDDPAVERFLLKNTVGNRLTFVETDRDLGLSFRYSWAACDAFGWVRTAVLEDAGGGPARLAVLDGLRNVLPFGAPLALYQTASTLVDAYKRSEVDAATGMGLFTLSAGITDRAEALESLRANTVWCCGPGDFRVHLSAAAITAFRQGRQPSEECELCGARGNYLLSFAHDLADGGRLSWRLAGDTGRDHVQVAALREQLRRTPDDDTAAGLAAIVDGALQAARENLRRNVASADGVQLTARREAWTHHFANVLFNNMRGGVFWRNHDVPIDDLVRFLRQRQPAVAERHGARLAALPAVLTIDQLYAAARAAGDPDLERLCFEYLPLHFGRRHGDPSRPWNRFAIRTRGAGGERELNYEGNWRDIFQNWEALAASFPAFLPGLVAKFVNASTVDGFNPYRLTRDGVDWEVASPDDPWGNIGYWGDHQLIYLLKLLEALDRHEPGRLESLLEAEVFSYAEVPYRLRPYERIVADPRDTIVFDAERQARIVARVEAMGSDGKLVQSSAGDVHHATLAEKLLVPTLSKLSNLVPGGGIWMNTQRPEWNDANNALGGGGVSVVTLCYLRRHLAFMAGLFARAGQGNPVVAEEVADWFEGVLSALAATAGDAAPVAADPRARRALLDRLGAAFTAYRETVYDHGFRGRRAVPAARVVALCEAALRHVDAGIAANRREDGLYHAYNLLDLEGDQARLGRLPEMLEGQVAVLSAGVLDAAASLSVVERLFDSALYRPDQHSFLLYPARRLPGYLARNVVPEAPALAVPLVTELLAAQETSLLARDADGVLRFDGSFGNARDLSAALDTLGAQERWRGAVARDRDAVLDLFEAVFRHHAFTGRSGAMYGYEGLGCIYWHMVAKLLLATQEVILRAERDGVRPALQADLAAIYFRIRGGLGFAKDVAEYGAFPADPYSHTPPDGGARQPGMTGQVKEEILTRLGELGVRVEAGRIAFRPLLLRDDEFLDRTAVLRGFTLAGEDCAVPLEPGMLAFTHCQVPVVYRRVDGPARVRVTDADDAVAEAAGNTLSARDSADLLARSGRLRRIDVDVPAATLLAAPARARGATPPPAGGRDR